MATHSATGADTRRTPGALGRATRRLATETKQAFKTTKSGSREPYWPDGTNQEQSHLSEGGSTASHVALQQAAEQAGDGPLARSLGSAQRRKMAWSLPVVT